MNTYVATSKFTKEAEFFSFVCSAEFLGLLCFYYLSDRTNVFGASRKVITGGPNGFSDSISSHFSESAKARVLIYYMNFNPSQAGVMLSDRVCHAVWFQIILYCCAMEFLVELHCNRLFISTHLSTN
jgi:hypothetical protein